MYKLVVLFAVVTISVAEPNRCDPFPSSRHCEPYRPQFARPCYPQCIPFQPCEETCVEKVGPPCVDKVVTTYEAPVVEKIITPAPIVEKVYTASPVVENVFTPCSGSFFNRVITPVTVPTTISHTYRKEIINEPVLASYPASVPLVSKAVYTTPYFPLAPYCGGFPGAFPAPFPSSFPAHFPASFQAHCAAPFPPASCVAPFPAAPCGAPFPAATCAAPFPAVPCAAPFPATPCAAPFPAVPCAAPFPAAPCAAPFPAPFSATFPAFSTQCIPHHVEHRQHEPRHHY